MTTTMTTPTPTKPPRLKRKVNSRIIALIVAGAMALLGGSAVVLYVSRADSRAVAGQQPVYVWVATKDVARGTTVAAAKASLEWQVIPEKSMPQAAAPQTLPDATFVASSDIRVGEVLLTGRFVAPTSVGPATIAIPDGKVAISASMGDYQKVGTFVSPGDWIAVFLTQQRNTNLNTSVLFSRVQVIGVGATSESTNSKDKAASPSSIMTIALSPQEAAMMVNRTQLAVGGKASLQFALLGADGSVPANVNATTKF